MTRIKITTLNPPTPGLRIQVLEFENELNVLVEGVLNEGGAFFQETDIDKDTIVVLVLTSQGGEELIRCRVPIDALNPMECFMTNPKPLSVDQAHKKFMAAHRKLKKNGVENPDPDLVARIAFM